MLDGWSIVVWLSGVIWLLGGFALLRWSWAAVLFLGFMVPLPTSWAQSMSLPLQTIATKLSCWTLQLLGQPVLAEGHTILIGDNQVEVEQACSGLRIFLGIIALAYACAMLSRRPIWERALILFSAVPVALIANGARIVATALLFQHVSGEFAQKFTHDIAGWFMIPLAAALFGVGLWYLSKLFPTVQMSDTSKLIRSVKGASV